GVPPFLTIIIPEWFTPHRAKRHSMTVIPEIRILHSLKHIPATAWNVLSGNDPFLRHEYLSALHETGCASKRTGWLPQFITLWEDDVLCGAMPLYLKSHFYGECVFDWAWAHAYQQHGYSYYPKLLSAIPFSPVTGRRLLARPARQRTLLISTALTMVRAGSTEKGEAFSSFHCLYPYEWEAEEMRDAGMMLRQGIQFHWMNRTEGGYENFEDFLGELSRDKRKKIHQERRRVQAEGIRFQWLRGDDVSMEH